MFLNRGEDEIVDRIEARIAKHTAIPKENGEGLQILHYQVSSFPYYSSASHQHCESALMFKMFACTSSKRYTHNPHSLQSLHAISPGYRG